FHKWSGRFGRLSPWEPYPNTSFWSWSRLQNLETLGCRNCTGTAYNLTDAFRRPCRPLGALGSPSRLPHRPLQAFEIIWLSSDIISVEGGPRHTKGCKSCKGHTRQPPAVRSPNSGGAERVPRVFTGTFETLYWRT